MCLCVGGGLRVCVCVCSNCKKMDDKSPQISLGVNFRHKDAETMKEKQQQQLEIIKYETFLTEFVTNTRCKICSA